MYKMVEDDDNGGIKARRIALYGPAPERGVRIRMKADDKWFEKFHGRLVRIYSGEHDYWYAKNGGYTAYKEEADECLFETAYVRTLHCGPGNFIQFDLVVEEPDLITALKACMELITASGHIPNMLTNCVGCQTLYHADKALKEKA